MKKIKQTLKYILDHKILLLIVLFAFVLTLIRFIFDGQQGCVNAVCGFIIGTNYRDGIWFLAVVATAFKTYPFQMPNFAGELLGGYHFIPNLITYLLTFIGIPSAVTFYQLIPIFFMVSMTLLSINLGRRIKDNIVFVSLFVFFVFFGMHLSLITSLYHTGTINNYVLINTFQATRLLESPHAALALLMLFAVIISLYTTKRTRRQSVINGVLLFLAFGTKFYVAAAMLGILVLYEVFDVIQTKKIKSFLANILIYAVGTVLSVLIIYDPFHITSTGSIFTFAPFATVHHLIENRDLFYSENLVLARYFLYENGWSPRLVAIELFSTFLFILFYFGTRIIGFLYLIYKGFKRELSKLDVAIFITITILIFCSVMFIQKGDWFNPIQFSVPAAYLLNIYAALFLYELIKKNRFIGGAITVIIVLLTFPANLVNLNYLDTPARYVVPKKNYEAMQFLKKQEMGSVFAPIDNDDTAIVSATSGKPLYVNYINGALNNGYPVEDRLQIIENTPEKLIEEGLVDYLYLPLSYEKSELLSKLCTQSVHHEIIYQENDVIICKKI